MGKESEGRSPGKLLLKWSACVCGILGPGAREVRVRGVNWPPKIWDWGQKIDTSLMSNRWFLTLTTCWKMVAARLPGTMWPVQLDTITVCETCQLTGRWRDITDVGKLCRHAAASAADTGRWTCDGGGPRHRGPLSHLTVTLIQIKHLQTTTSTLSITTSTCVKTRAAQIND